MGFHWRPSGPHPRSPNCHVGWGPGDGRPFGTEKTCVRVEGCPGMRWQSISQVSPYVKIGMLNRNRPRTIFKVGAVSCHIYSAVVLFSLGKIPTEGLKCALTLLTADGCPWHCGREVGSGPLPGEIPARVKTGDMF